MRKFSIILCGIILAFSISSHVNAAIYIPDFSTTYIPPSVESMMDILYNVYGVTAPNISTGKLQAYLTLYRGILGASFDKFYEDLQGFLTNLKQVVNLSLTMV